MKSVNALWVRATLALVALAAIPRLSLGAEVIAAKDMRQNLFASCFVNEEEGWTVGDLGRIFHTADGAKTWTRQDAGTKRPFVALACQDANKVWAAGQAGQIAHTADDGNTWNMQTTGTDRQLLDVSFADAERGLAVGDFGIMIRTEDGGLSWTKIALPEDTKLPPDIAEVVMPGDILLYSISFADRDHVWVAGEFGVILASADGGLTWRSQDTPIEITLFGIFFADHQNGWAVGLESTLLRTTDGGISWVKQEIETPPGFFLALYDIEVRGKYGWAVGNSGFLLNSTDAGATWQLISVPVGMRGSWFREVSLFPNGRGYIVGEAGSVLTTNRNQFTALREAF